MVYHGRFTKTLLFVYSHQYPELWKDGLWKALRMLNKSQCVVDMVNLFYNEKPRFSEYRNIVAWGAFGSPADNFVQSLGNRFVDAKKVLCIAGNAVPAQNLETYDGFFCETDWYIKQLVQLTDNPFIFKAFGVNTQIFYPKNTGLDYIWDYLSVGSFSNWKRHEKIIDKPGSKMVIGEIQKNNLDESLDIIGNLLVNGVGVSDMVSPEKLSNIYNSSKTVYIPANVIGGGERAVLEARYCGCVVEIEPDNLKLKELMDLEKVPTHEDYYESLKNGLNHINYDSKKNGLKNAKRK